MLAEHLVDLPAMQAIKRTKGNIIINNTIICIKA